ncbi:tyrosyl-DNA phosphodiesterase-domain-containing protein [Mycena leptocephala]|nr:tyrosyl-DNA phosphodiesterase-domain-containing protein [Mycena leptocephala]
MSVDSEDNPRATAPSLEEQQAKTRTSSGRQMFPDGELLRVDTMHATKVETPSIRLGGVLCPCDELAFTILSTFIALSAIQSGAEECLPELGPRVPPLTGGGGGRGCMHMKYMLLFVKSGALRIVIGSANLVPHEWRHIENHVFIQDFPRATPGMDTVKLRAGEKPSEAFPAVLVATLRATGVEEALAILIRQGDWSRVRVALVSSVPGKWEGWAEQREGQGEGREWENLKSKGKSKENVEGYELELDYLTSSIGTYSVPWIAVFRLCAGGRAQALRAYLDRGSPHRARRASSTPRLRPSVAPCSARRARARCPARAQWAKVAVLNADPTTALQMRDTNSRGGGVGVHAKMILGTLRCASAQDDDTKNETESEGESTVEIVDAAGKPLRRPHAWFNVGSHNFSVSAWGAPRGSGFNPVLNVVNYELGIVLRLERPEDVDAAVACTRKYTEGDAPWCALRRVAFIDGIAAFFLWRRDSGYSVQSLVIQLMDIQTL